MNISQLAVSILCDITNYLGAAETASFALSLDTTDDDNTSDTFAILVHNKFKFRYINWSDISNISTNSINTILRCITNSIGVGYLDGMSFGGCNNIDINNIRTNNNMISEHMRRCYLGCKSLLKNELIIRCPRCSIHGCSECLEYKVCNGCEDSYCNNCSPDDEEASDLYWRIRDINDPDDRYNHERFGCETIKTCNECGDCCCFHCLWNDDYQFGNISCGGCQTRLNSGEGGTSM